MRTCAAMLAAFALLLPVGCGDDSESGSEATQTTGTTSEAPTGTTTAPTTAAAESSTTTVEAEAWPAERGYHEMVYDAGSDVVLVFGGSFGEPPTALYDMWSVTPGETRWQQHDDLPGRPEVGSPAAYDSQSDRTVSLQTVFFDDDPASTWAYDVETDGWEQMAPAEQPRLGVGARLVYDSESDRIIAFGGLAVSGEELVGTPGTWAYDYNTDTWEQRTTATEPPTINYHATAYDAQSDRVVLFGLTDLGETLLWAYDDNTSTWEELPVVDGPPSASAYARAVYDAASDRVVVLGGLRLKDPDDPPADPLEFVDATEAHGELWRYDYDTNSWEPGTSSELPGPLNNHAMTVVGDGTLLVFGGGESWQSYTGDAMWAYDLAADTWTEMS